MFPGCVKGGKYDIETLPAVNPTTLFYTAFKVSINSPLPSKCHFIMFKTFRFIARIDSKYNPISRTSVRTALDNIASQTNAQLKNKLAKVMHVSTTVDIWSDRKMRGYLGVTVHGIHDDEASDMTLFSYLLTCHRYILLFQSK